MSQTLVESGIGSVNSHVNKDQVCSTYSAGNRTLCCTDSASYHVAVQQIVLKVRRTCVSTCTYVTKNPPKVMETETKKIGSCVVVSQALFGTTPFSSMHKRPFDTRKRSAQLCSFGFYRLAIRTQLLPPSSQVHIKNSLPS